MEQIFIYGLAGARDQFRPVRYYRIDTAAVSISYINHVAWRMKTEYPSIEHVYAIDSHPGLYRSYTEAWKTCSIESCAIFKDLLERFGLKII